MKRVIAYVAIGLLARPRPKPQVSLEDAIDAAHRKKVEVFQLQAQGQERLGTLS